MYLAAWLTLLNTLITSEGKKKNSSAYSNFMLESKQHMKEGIRLEDKILESR